MSTTKVSHMLYPYSWELAVSANQERYPTHERYPMLKASEILSDDLFFSQQDIDAFSQHDSSISSIHQPYRQGDHCTCHLDLVLLSANGEQRQSNPVPNLTTFPPRVDVPEDIIAMMPYNANVEPLVPFFGIRRIVRRCHFELPNALRMLPTSSIPSDMIIRHETWIDSSRRQMTVVTLNETASSTATVGDVTIYRALDGQDAIRPWRGKAPVAPLTPEYAIASSLSSPSPSSLKWCLFMQYAYFQVSPSFKIPFRTKIERTLLNLYRRNTEKGRMLDMEIMAQRANQQKQEDPVE
ncbi:hypothetical protein K492DRAFT_205474 [Lichtheimia hyalospora FSU 10163]|nr:hypothetical protein K492DRAFT_205474 [Lichtheimia hyalospora FSU 10163]